MNRIEKLINEFCPDGVEYVKIGDVVNYEQPTKYIVKNTDYHDEFNTPVLTANQTFILGYTNEENNIYQATSENPVIIFDDFTGAFKWVDFPFKVKSSAMKILTAYKNKTFIRYIFHIMGKISFSSNEHKRLWINFYSEFRIPLPPTKIQHEIGCILDSFTEYTNLLEKELELRKKQYSYYRDMLLDFGDDVSYKTLEEIAVKISSGKNKEKNQEGTYPVYGSTGIIAYCEKYKYDKKQILIARVGANAGYVHIAEKKYDVSDNTIMLNLKDTVLFKYIYYLCFT